MKIFLLIIFLSILVGACSQRSVISSQKFGTLDCKVLEKKQRQQLRMAMRHSRVNERRKSMVSKPGYTAAIKKSRITERTELASIKEQPINSKNAYSVSLTTGPTGLSRTDNILHEKLRQYHMLANTKLLIQSSAMPEPKAVFVKFENDMLVWPAMVMSSIVGMGMMTIFMKQAKSLSRWSKENKFKARFILVLIKIGTCIGCFSLGDELYNSGFIVAEYLRIPTLGILASALAFYPSKYFASGAPAFGFLERKFYDASIFAAGAIVMLYAGNHFNVSVQRVHQVQTVANVTLPANRFGLEDNVVSVGRKEFKQQVKKLLKDKPKELTKGEKTALTVLAVLAGIALTFGVSALSCSLACSGAEMASFLVGAGGVGLIVWGLASTIRSIHRRPTKKGPPAVKSVT